jgi:hypothetical protein
MAGPQPRLAAQGMLIHHRLAPAALGARRRDPQTLFQRLGGRHDGTSARLGRAQQPPTPGVEVHALLVVDDRHAARER